MILQAVHSSVYTRGLFSIPISNRIPQLSFGFSVVANKIGNKYNKKFDNSSIVTLGKNNNTNGSLAAYVPPNFISSQEDEFLETYREKGMRWLDITGFFTRWNSRREWLLSIDPSFRNRYMHATEYERKLHMLMGAGVHILVGLLILNALIEIRRSKVQTPIPLPHETREMVFNRKSNNYYLYAEECEECRPDNLECIKECVDTYRYLGMKRRGYTQKLGASYGIF